MVGPLLERGLLRFMYGKDEVVLLLVTYAVFLILEDVIKLVWGVESCFVAEPYALPGNFTVGGLAYPVYNLILIGAAVVDRARARLGLYRTRAGKLLLAVIHDREISAAMGINVDRVYLVTFTIGATLAALGGALTAPTVAVSPGIGVEVIVLSFAVVVIGGLGSLGGAALGALMVGVVRSVTVRYWPEAELFTIYVVMALVLIARPKGLFAAPRRARYEAATARRSRSRSLRSRCSRPGRSRRSGSCSCSRSRSPRAWSSLGLLLLMRTGLVSFGQGLYFGLGAYAAALLGARFGIPTGS